MVNPNHNSIQFTHDKTQVAIKNPINFPFLNFEYFINTKLTKRTGGADLLRGELTKSGAKHHKTDSQRTNKLLDVFSKCIYVI